MENSATLKKTFLWFAAFSGALFLILLLALYDISRTQAAIAASHSARYQSYLLANELRFSSEELTRLARTYVVTGDSKYEQQYLDILEVRNGRKPRADGRTIALEALMRDAGFTEQEFNKLKEAQANSNALVATEVKAMNAVKGLFDDGSHQYTRKGEPDMTLARTLMHDENYHKYKATIMKPVDEFVALLDQRTGDAVTLAEQTNSRRYFMVLLLQLTSIGVTLGGLYVVYRALWKLLGAEPAVAAGVARQIAAGDLTVAVPVASGDSSSLLHSMAAMRNSLASIVTQVRTGTDAIVSASTQIASGNTDLANRTEAQATSVERTASSMEELNTTVAQNSANAQAANDMARSASDIARKGGEVVSSVVDTMSSINDASRKIVDIITVIDGIAFQTNILALNAAVEAARAGEQGRGFAVVATEVRNLAQRSAAAAKEIKILIDSSVERVNTGSRLVEEAGSTMTDIVRSINSVTRVMGEITDATRMQTEGIGRINQAVAEMDDVTQQNAALVEQASAAAVSLQEQAQTLAQTVGLFQLEPQAGNVHRLQREPERLRGDALNAPRLALRRIANGVAD
ncbi:methyl-accepting chemotaxis protein [Duganella fentianensis]|uniref:methyl-accepting chemotaxis protein n=1 Tax=Duganella fentianensis TaxID=2692177 RepID=UPI0032B15AEB